MADNIFIDGLHIKKPPQGAPDFIKGKVSIHAPRLIEFVEKYKNENGYVNIDLKESKDGGLYFALNTYKKEVQGNEASKGNDQIAPDDIPF